MSRNSVSSIELLLGLFGSALAGLFWLGGYIWRTYNQTFDDLGDETQQGNDNE
ncbi:hypothetical protein D3C84_1265220 [compost metagenome]